jgi:hypothetical protein
VRICGGGWRYRWPVCGCVCGGLEVAGWSIYTRGSGGGYCGENLLLRLLGEEEEIIDDTLG